MMHETTALDEFNPVIPQYDEAVQRLLLLLQQIPPSVSRQQAAEIIRSTMCQMLSAVKTPIVQTADDSELARNSFTSVLVATQKNQAEQLEHARRYLEQIALYQERIRQLDVAVQTCQNQANELSELLDAFLLGEAPVEALRPEIHRLEEVEALELTRVS